VPSFDSAVVRDALDLRSRVETLRTMLRDGCEAPLRHHHAVATLFKSIGASVEDLAS